jgi:predicted MFS family arabinose efflux permease
VILFVSMIPSMLANNSLNVVCVTHIPREKLGYHMSRITALWNIPFLLLAIACAWYVDQREPLGDEAFYRAMFVVFLVTGIFQLPATWLMWRLGNDVQPADDTARAASLRDVATPFVDRRFRPLLAAILAISTIGAMVITFIYPYMLMAMKWQMYQIGMLEAGAGMVGFLIMPLWGNLTDRIGGKNVMRLSAFGVAAALFFMVGGTATYVFVAAVLAWKTTTGIFGAGMATGQQYLMLSLAEHGRRNIYIAASTFVFGCGMLIGALVGGYLLEWLAQRVDPLKPYEHYRIYFLFCAMAFLLTGNFIGALRDGRKKIRKTELAVAFYRRIRTFGGRRG